VDRADFGSKNILADTAETLVQRGFRKSGLRKILLSKNLDIKILITNRLAGQVSRWADRHCLDHDRAIRIWAQGQISQGAVEKVEMAAWPLSAVLPYESSCILTRLSGGYILLGPQKGGSYCEEH